MNGLGWVFGAALAGMVSAAAAQGGPAPGGTVQAGAPEAATAEPRPAPTVRRPRPRTATKPPPLEIAKHPSPPPPPRTPGAAANAQAPVPNRNLEGPRAVVEDRASLNPSVINRNLPGRGHAATGTPTLLEDKLFTPAPGARLSLPFSY